MELNILKQVSINPLISIIVPIYNSDSFLDQTINSVISQTYSQWELILVNNGSTDGSKFLMDSYEKKDRRIKCIHFEKNSGGPAFPRNEGMKIAKGEYIAFLDSDDFWEKEKLEKQISQTDSKTKLIISSEAFMVDEHNNNLGELKKSNFFKRLKKFFDFKNIFLIYNPIILSTSLVKKSPDLKFQENENLQSIEDWALWIDLVSTGYELKIIDTPLCSYRVHKDSLSNKNNENQYKKGYVLYKNLYLEGRIEAYKYYFLIMIQSFRLLKFKFLGRK